MDYTDALTTIYSTIRRSETLDRGRPRRTRALLERTGAPDDGLRVVHVTGTKGKGSVCAMLAAALRANGYRVGMYTSPHVHTLRERIQVDGQPIPQEALVRLVGMLEPHLAAVEGVGFPEVMTTLALHYFAARDVDVGVVEVHVGGMYDATNVFDERTLLASVINVIDYDHTALLGRTLAEIAGQKAGIIRAGVPVVSAPQADEVRAVLQRHTGDEVGQTALTMLGEDVAFHVAPPSGEGQRVSIDGEWFETNLRGAHQGINLAVAVTTLQKIADEFPIRDIHAGWGEVAWPGRLETVASDGENWLLDIGHNAAAADALGAYLDAVYPDARRVVVFGAKADKDARAILAALLRPDDALVLTQVNDPPTTPPEALLGLAPPVDFVMSVGDVPSALGVAVEARHTPDDVLLVTGSIFIVSAARAYLLGIPPEDGSAR